MTDASQPQQPRTFCRDCGHWEHDPGACDGLGHEWDGPSGLPVATDCACEVHDDQRAVEPPLTVDPRTAILDEIQAHRRQGVTWEPPVSEKVERWYAEGYDRGLRDADSIVRAAASVPLPVDPECLHWATENCDCASVPLPVDPEAIWAHVNGTRYAAPTPTAPPALDVERLARAIQDSGNGARDHQGRIVPFEELTESFQRMQRQKATRILARLSGTEPGE